MQGRPLMTTWPFLRRAEHCIGKVSDAPAEAVSKVCWCCGRREGEGQLPSSLQRSRGRAQGGVREVETYLLLWSWAR